MRSAADSLTQSHKPHRPRVVMLLANPFVHDTRVYKQARTLIGWGCDVQIIAIHKPDLPEHEVRDEIQVVRVPMPPAGPIRVVLDVLAYPIRPVLARLISRPAPADAKERQDSRSATAPSRSSASVARAGAGAASRFPSRLNRRGRRAARGLVNRLVSFGSTSDQRMVARIRRTRAALEGHLSVRGEPFGRRLARLPRRFGARLELIAATRARPTLTRPISRRFAPIHARMERQPPKVDVPPRPLANEPREPQPPVAEQPKPRAPRPRHSKFVRAIYRRAPARVRLLGFNHVLASHAASSSPDLVIAHDLNTLLAGVLVKRIVGCPLVYDSHELYLERNIGGASRAKDKAWWGPIERRCISRADAVFTVAEGIARHLERQYRLDRVHLLRNVQPYEPPPERTDLLARELGTDPETRLVIYPGAITINRGLEQLVDAAVFLQSAAFVVMGYANNPAYLESLLERARANGTLGVSIFFKDPVPINEVVRWVASADLGVVPTQGVCLSYRFESSNKMFHCLMAGVPLAMSDHEEKRLLIERCNVGVLFDETDPRAIARAVQGVLDDEPQRLGFAENCLAAAGDLNWQIEESNYVRIMHGLLGTGAPPLPPPPQIPVTSGDPEADETEIEVLSHPREDVATVLDRKS